MSDSGKGMNAGTIATMNPKAEIVHALDQNRNLVFSSPRQSYRAPLDRRVRLH